VAPPVANDWPGGSEPTSAAAAAEKAGPPYLWLALALALGVAGIVGALAFGQIVPVAWGSWVASGPVAIGLLAVFLFMDNRERAKPTYGNRSSAIWLYRGGLAIAFVGIVLSALRIAEWAGRTIHISVPL